MKCRWRLEAPEYVDQSESDDTSKNFLNLRVKVHSELRVAAASLMSSERSDSALSSWIVSASGISQHEAPRGGNELAELGAQTDRPCHHNGAVH